MPADGYGTGRSMAVYAILAEGITFSWESVSRGEQDGAGAVARGRVRSRNRRGSRSGGGALAACDCGRDCDCDRDCRYVCDCRAVLPSVGVFLRLFQPRGSAHAFATAGVLVLGEAAPVSGSEPL